jgi:hypothetical protein
MLGLPTFRSNPLLGTSHNPLDVVGGAAVGLAIAALLDLVLDVARDRAGRRPEASTS